MATIVLVHGIAQEQYSADLLESRWLPALAGGVRIAGHPQLADRLWRVGRPGDIEARMAFYGNVFLPAYSQGGTGSVEMDDSELELAEQLAAEWLAAAAERAADPRDRRRAQRELDAMAMGDEGAQGIRAAARPAANVLAGLTWFAPLGFGLAKKFVQRALSQVTHYLTDAEVRDQAQQQVLDLIGTDTRLVIAHSLGSVVAYEALHYTDQPVALLTLGSPLALQTIIYPRLRPQPACVPASLTRWDNLADRDDLVATHLDLAPYFPPAPGRTVIPATPEPIDNGSKPHEIEHYLTKKAVGTITADALA